MKHKRIIFVLLMLAMLLPTLTTSAQPSGLPVDVPREDLFVIDQIFRHNVIDNYNFWVNGPNNAHRHAMMMETLWIRDMETGERINDLANSEPIYNDDFTQMNVDLRDNIYWSDGEQFTADDVIFTVETIKANPALNSNGWSTQLNQYLDSIEKTGDFSVQFNLLESNPRFHTLFEARWNGIYMMPQHTFESIEDLATYTYTDGPVLGAYLPVEMDPNGFWELFERREDWQNSPAGVITGNAGPQYVLTIYYGDSTRKAIAMSRGELDVFFDVDFEAFEAVLNSTPTARSWYTEFPWAYPNEVDTRQFIFNLEDPILSNRDVRWALALSLNMVEMQTEYLGGVVKVTVMPTPPTQLLSQLYHEPMQEWLINYELDLGNGEMFQPYDATIPDQIAAWAEEQGYTVPGTPTEVFGYGWWKFAPEAAEQLLVNNGFSRDANGNWLTPDGEPWTLTLQAPVDENDQFRMATAAADMWSDFGINVDLQALERSVADQNRYVGQFQIAGEWETYTLPSGDVWPEARGLHSQYFVPLGEDYRNLGGTNQGRVLDPRIDELLDEMASVNPDSPESQALGQEFMQLWIDNMYEITGVAFKKFVTWDERYWTGFPTSENPDYMPLYWFQGGKFAIQNLTSSN